MRRQLYPAGCGVDYGNNGPWTGLSYHQEAF
jgi:hypothetical protein